VVRRIIRQADVQTRVPHNVHHARHTLSLVAVIFWAIIEMDDPWSAGRAPGPDGHPPRGGTSGETVPRDCGAHAGEKALIGGGAKMPTGVHVATGGNHERWRRSAAGSPLHAHTGRL
jgi:hypothetical protein